MRNHFFVLIYATDAKERTATVFRSYHDVQEVVDWVNDWLEKFCFMDCYYEAQAEALKAANGGELPETAFLCPEVKTPADLTKYNGFYNYGSLGMFNLFLTPVYDGATARRFCASMNKEYGIDQEYSEEADRMLEHMRTFMACFDDDSLDYGPAEKAMEQFIRQEGFSLFNDDEPAYPEFFVMPKEGLPRNDDPTV